MPNQFLYYLSYLSYVGYAIIFLLLVLFLKSYLSDFIDLIINSIKRNSKQSNKSNKNTSHLYILLEQIYGKSDSGTVGVFYIISLSFGLVGILVGKNSTNFYVKFLLPILLAAIPYIYLRLKSRQLIIEGSYEGITVVSELLQQYRLSNTNMLTAIEKTVSVLNSYADGKVKHLNKYLTRLGVRLNGYKDDDELDSIIYIFYKSINTEWGNMLSSNILMSVKEHIDVGAGLEDILKELKEAKKVQEYGDRKSFEGFMVGIFVTPVLYLLSILIANKFFGFSVSKFFEYQLKTDAGSFLLFLIISIYIVNFIIGALYKKRKFDF